MRGDGTRAGGAPSAIWQRKKTGSETPLAPTTVLSQAVAAESAVPDALVQLLIPVAYSCALGFSSRRKGIESNWSGWTWSHEMPLGRGCVLAVAINSVSVAT